MDKQTLKNLVSPLIGQVEMLSKVKDTTFKISMERDLKQVGLISNISSISSSDRNAGLSAFNNLHNACFDLLEKADCIRSIFVECYMCQAYQFSITYENGEFKNGAPIMKHLIYTNRGEVL